MSNETVMKFMSTKKLEEKNRRRDALLALDNKILAPKGLADEAIRDLLLLYGVDARLGKSPRVREQLNPVLAAKMIKENWLVDVYVDGIGMLRVRDLATTDNWVVDCISVWMDKIESAFGYCDFVIAASDFCATTTNIEK